MRLSRPWLTQGLRFKQPPVPDSFSLLETVLAAVLLVVTTLSTYSLFQVNMNVSKFSHELDAADRELSANMQEIRLLGARLNWCNDTASVSPADCGQVLPLTQSYYSKSLIKKTDATTGVDVDTEFAKACKKDVGLYQFPDRFYFEILSKDDVNASKEPLLTVLVKAIFEYTSNVKRIVLLEKTTRRLLIELEKSVSKGELGGSRKVTRYLYLVPEVAKWCPS